jgi:hypothetical protein
MLALQLDCRMRTLGSIVVQLTGMVLLQELEESVLSIQQDLVFLTEDDQSHGPLNRHEAPDTS